MGEAGISQIEIAKRAGMSKQRLANILAGRPGTSNVKLETLGSLASAVGVEPKELMK